jgi:hypothetical protein
MSYYTLYIAYRFQMTYHTFVSRSYYTCNQPTPLVLPPHPLLYTHICFKGHIHSSIHFNIHTCAYYIYIPNNFLHMHITHPTSQHRVRCLFILSLLTTRTQPTYPHAHVFLILYISNDKPYIRLHIIYICIFKVYASHQPTLRVLPPHSLCCSQLTPAASACQRAAAKNNKTQESMISKWHSMNVSYCIYISYHICISYCVYYLQKIVQKTFKYKLYFLFSYLLLLGVGAQELRSFFGARTRAVVRWVDRVVAAHIAQSIVHVIWNCICHIKL